MNASYPDPIALATRYNLAVGHCEMLLQEVADLSHLSSCIPLLPSRKIKELRLELYVAHANLSDAGIALQKAASILSPYGDEGGSK